MKVDQSVFSILNFGSEEFFTGVFDFNKVALNVFRYQSQHCHIYKLFLDAYGWKWTPDQDLSTIPFLPIDAFKHHQVQTGIWQPEKVFKSSGTTGSLRSQHLVRSVDAYHMHTIRLFQNTFGSLRDFSVLALLPNYLEAGDSSLVSMIEAFMVATGQQERGFYMNDFCALKDQLIKCIRSNKRILLFGVTFALLDFAEKYPLDLPGNSMIIETGGMKGRGTELSRQAMHGYLSKQFGVPAICSEYGMTELMSQAYSTVNGHYKEASSMHVFIKEINDPMAQAAPGKSGVLHIVDLANINTCSFIATSDLGIKHPDGTFDVIGRLDHSDIRGCHLMYI